MGHVMDIAALCDVELVPGARTACYSFFDHAISCLAELPIPGVPEDTDKKC